MTSALSLSLSLPPSPSLSPPLYLSLPLPVSLPDPLLFGLTSTCTRLNWQAFQSCAGSSVPNTPGTALCYVCGCQIHRKPRWQCSPVLQRFSAPPLALNAKSGLGEQSRAGWRGGSANLGMSGVGLQADPSRPAESFLP